MRNHLKRLKFQGLESLPVTWKADVECHNCVAVNEVFFLM